MSPEDGNQQSLAAEAVSAELSPAGGACKVPRSIRRSSPLHRPESRACAAQPLDGPRLPCLSWELGPGLLLAAPATPAVVSLLHRAAVGCSPLPAATSNGAIHEVKSSRGVCVGRLRGHSKPRFAASHGAGALLIFNFTPCLLPPPALRPLSTGPSSRYSGGHRLSRSWHTDTAAYTQAGLTIRFP